MVQAYNFLASWQLFPEKGTYEKSQRPKSGTYRIEATESKKELSIAQNWVSLENQAFSAGYTLLANGELHAFTEQGEADGVRAEVIDGITFEVCFYKKAEQLLRIVHEIMPNGYLRIIREGTDENGKDYHDVEYYHKQLSVLPYAASVSGALIKPTEEGVIKHKALVAMEEQTNMQLDQIRKQIELLALQAQEIQQRKDLSLKIYEAKLSFTPNIGQHYYLYEKKDGQHLLSLVAPKEWGASLPFKRFVAAVQLLADHTWKEC
jgi:predicted transcriptional regulator